jgi:hypothetical protein
MPCLCIFPQIIQLTKQTFSGDCLGWPVANESWIKFRAAIDTCATTRGYPIVMSVESCDDPNSCGLWIGKLANLWRTGESALNTPFTCPTAPSL